MRAVPLFGVLIALLGAPSPSPAQVFQLPTPHPQVTAAASDWQVNGEPIYYDGSFYHPTGPTVFFDGNVMTRTGVFRGVPLYQDRTLEPYSVVFVPVGGTVMRPYERRREGTLAGTVGSRLPSFPVQRDAEVSLEHVVPEALTLPGSGAAATAGTGSIGTGGFVAPPAAAPAPVTPSPPRPTGNDGIWIEVGGVRYFSDGPAESFSPERYTPAGEYRGFPVYRTAGDASVVWIPTVRDGPVTPYRRR